MIKTYRVFPDYCATGVWGEIGANPYIIEEVDLLGMGASNQTIALLAKMQYVYTVGSSSQPLHFAEERFIRWCGKTAAKRLAKETGFKFRWVG